MVAAAMLISFCVHAALPLQRRNTQICVGFSPPEYLSASLQISSPGDWRSNSRRAASGVRPRELPFERRRDLDKCIPVNTAVTPFLTQPLGDSGESSRVKLHFSRLEGRRDPKPRGGQGRMAGARAAQGVGTPTLGVEVGTGLIRTWPQTVRWGQFVVKLKPSVGNIFLFWSFFCLLLSWWLEESKWSSLFASIRRPSSRLRNTHFKADFVPQEVGPSPAAP